MSEFKDPPESAKPAKPAIRGTSADSAEEIAAKLLQAGSHGENLMKELDFLSSSRPGLPSQAEVLKKMIDYKNDHQFGNVELLDSDGKPVTNRKNAFGVQEIVSTAADGHKSILYRSAWQSGARELYDADQKNILSENKLEQPHTDDVKKIIEGFQKAVDDMVASGHRLSGQGAVMGVINNVMRADFGGKQYDCVDQALDVLSHLKKLKLEGQWDFHMVGDPPHYTVEVVPHSGNDPIIKMDPWRGRDHYELRESGKTDPDQRVNPWMDDQSKIHWS